MSRRRTIAEVLGLLAWFGVFAWLHSLVGRAHLAATANASTLQSIERALHLDIVLPVNQWLAGHVGLAQAAAWFYRAYYLVVAGVLIWVFRRDVAVYRRVRRAMILMMVLVLPVYWAVPMSPPRFALPGTVDIVALYGIVGHASRAGGWTAMPSMHVGWSLWCAFAVWTALRVTHPRAALLAWTFPLLMVAVVIATANHYVLDIVGSVLLVSTAITLTAFLPWPGSAHPPAERPDSSHSPSG
ncbi:phosphatase PAP2 family protein [Actinoplanes sichuanensis]|uniref:Phosphatase PAP2 family protein n=1 Tax=Actinoplanes sichuanensis TaxID=512349 RepID=A0ABW4A783_9ACTN|nr:phosphatase PAP2 family protein [Actinoplanes sichuanensis]BEL03661.1 phosphatase PAP2 family protein [Actinoplanes sichuanensis]